MSNTFLYGDVHLHNNGKNNEIDIYVDSVDKEIKIHANVDSTLNFGTSVAPTDGDHLTNKTYVDALVSAAIQGLSWLESCKYTSDANVDLTDATPGNGLGDVTGLDGTVIVLSEDRILLQDQTDATENGIWLANTDGLLTSWTRSLDMDVGKEARANATWVNEGLTYSDKGFVCTNDIGSDIVGTDPLTFVNFSGSSISSFQTIYEADSQPQITLNSTQGSFQIKNATPPIAGDLFEILDNSGNNLMSVDSTTTINLGAANELTVGHDAINGSITNNTGDLFIINNGASSGDHIFVSVNGSANNSVIISDDVFSPLFSVNGTGLVTATNDIVIPLDNTNLSIGASQDVKLFHDSTDSYITTTTGDFIINNTNVTGDTTCKLATNTNATSFKVLDVANAEQFVVYGNGDVEMPNDSTLSIGPSAELKIDHSVTNNTDSTIESNSGDFHIVQSSTAGKLFFTNEGTTNVANIEFETQGVGASMNFNANDSTGACTFSINSVQYVRMAPSGGINYFRCNDNVVGAYGNGRDLQIKHDSTNSFITNTTGDLTIENEVATNDVIVKLGTATNATKFVVVDSADAEQFKVEGDGSCTITDLGSGDVQATAGLLSVTSDERLKRINGDVEHGLEAILKIDPIFFNFNHEPDDAPTQIGFSAQNIQQAIPEAVIENPKTGYLGLQTRGIIASLVNSIKTLNQRIEQLESS